MIEWIRSRLSQEQLDFLHKLPLTETLDVDGLGRVLFCHATPRGDDELLTRISSDEQWQRAWPESGPEEATEFFERPSRERA